MNRRGVVLLAAALILAACGARLDKNVRTEAADAALHPGNGAAVAPSSGNLTGGDQTVGPSAGPASQGPSAGNGSVTPGAPGAPAVGSPATGSASAANPGAPAPAGGNGGATDVGVTATDITIGNVADLSGPVPGLFQGAADGVDAYRAYINSQGGIFGRQLKISEADSQTDCTADENAHTNLLPHVLAFVGSFELYDDCGTKVEQQHPDVADFSYALGLATKQNTVNRFPPEIAPSGYPNGMFCAEAKMFPSAVTKAGSIYGNIPSAAYSQRMISHAAETCGFHFVDQIPVGATQTTFNAEMSKMQTDGVKLIFEISTTQGTIAEMKREADQQNWHPAWIAPVFYASNSIQLLGNAQEAEGIVGHNLYSLFFSADDARNIPEVGLFQHWMQLTHPNDGLDLFGMYAWAAAKLFVQELRAVGPNLTRKALLAAIRSVHSYDAGGMVAASDVGGHQPGVCYLLWQIHSGQFQRLDTPASQFRCDGKFIPYSGG